ncbi:MAG: hypothetical protein Q9159_004489 [Coniocarpon cinnabarinum]
MISEGWLVARRTLNTLALQAKRWEIEVPVEAAIILNRFLEQQGPSSSSHRSEGSEQDNASPGNGTQSPFSGTSSQQGMFTIDQALQEIPMPMDTGAWGSWIPGSFETQMPGSNMGISQPLEQGFMPGVNSLAQDMSINTSLPPTQGLSAWTVDYSTRPQMSSLESIQLATMSRDDQYAQQSAMWQQQTQKMLQLQRERQALQQRPQSNVTSPSAVSPSIATPDEFIPSPVSMGSGSSTNQSYFSQTTTQTPQAVQSGVQTPFKTPSRPQHSRSQTLPQPGSTQTAHAATRTHDPSWDRFGGVHDLLHSKPDWWATGQREVHRGFARWNKKKA